MKLLEANKVQQLEAKEGKTALLGVSQTHQMSLKGVRKIATYFLQSIREKQALFARSAAVRMRLVMKEQAGQGTTEYAILVGVLVVIAIVAIVAFKGKIQELWSAISDGINSL